MQTTRMASFDAPRPAPAAAAPAPPKPAAPPPKPAEPLVSDDLFAQLTTKPKEPAAPAFDPMATQKMPSGSDQTQRMPAGSDRTQRMDAGPESTQRIDKPVERTQRMDVPPAERTQRMDQAPAPKPAPPRSAADGDKTVQIPRLDPNYKPEATQKFEPLPETTHKLVPPPSVQKPEPSPAATQRIDPSPPTQPLTPASGDAETTQRVDDSIWRLQEAQRILQGISQK
jgi:hypothetical protein